MHKAKEIIKKEIYNKYTNGDSVDSLTQRYSIPKSTIYRWINNQEVKQGGTTPTTIEIKSLLSENKKLKQERDILKRAIEIISTRE